MTHILIVEDEEKISSLLQEYCQQQGFIATVIADGSKVEPWLASNHCDAMVLDIMLPNVDGITLCKNIRTYSTVAILMLSARTEEIDRLLGLELGADDYISKPFSPREVIARIKAVLRRTESLASSTSALLETSAKEQTAPWLSPNDYQLYFNRQPLHLSAIEYSLMAAMMARPGQVFTRQQLMDVMYQDGRIVSERTIDSHIKKLRQKIQQGFDDLNLIHSIYGLGYKYQFQLEK